MTLYAIDNQRYSYATGGNIADRIQRDRAEQADAWSTHACNCIGCCPDCGTCRTWPGHTAQYCRLLQRQAQERAALCTCMPKDLHLRGGVAHVDSSRCPTHGRARR